MKRIFLIIILATFVAINSSAQVTDSPTNNAKENTEDSGTMRTIVDLSTILIGIMTVASGIVSVKVMRSQRKTQEEALNAQKREHQPNFVIKLRTAPSDHARNTHDYEEFTIENIGEAMLARDRITVSSFIKVRYIDIHNKINKTAYYPLIYYFLRTSSTSNMKGLMLCSVESDKLGNHEKYCSINAAAIAYSATPGKPKIMIDKINVFEIPYVDIYEDKRTAYYLGECRTTKETYDEIKNSAPNFFASKSIEDVTLTDLIDFIKTV